MKVGIFIMIFVSLSLCAQAVPIQPSGTTYCISEGMLFVRREAGAIFWLGGTTGGWWAMAALPIPAEEVHDWQGKWLVATDSRFFHLEGGAWIEISGFPVDPPLPISSSSMSSLKAQYR